MNELDINDLLDRKKDAAQMKEILLDFERNKHNVMTKKGIYVYGDPGSGKTSFVTNVLKEMNYDVIRYDAGDIRNKSIIDTITKHNMSDKNVMSLFHKKVQKIAIVMDEIDGMNNGDKGGINSLIKVIRPKKTKKQRVEDVTLIPIICIGNYHVDKKIKELMKVCSTVEIKAPTIDQVRQIIRLLMPEDEVGENIVRFMQGDLRKLSTMYEIYKQDKDFFKANVEQMNKLFRNKSYNDDTRKITGKLINQPYNIQDHLTLMNETDRTIVGLLWHENIIDVLNKMKKEESIPFYCQLLENMCFADYIDRITFQKQIWQFNEMSSLIKTFKNSKIYHDAFENLPKIKQHFAPTEVRFTKVLTKYSTEYNNSIFVQSLCNQLGMDKKDMIAFFMSIKDKEHESLFENYEISKLDINRIYRYIEKYTTENAVTIDDKVDSDIED